MYLVDLPHLSCRVPALLACVAQNMVTPDGQVQRAWRGEAQAGSLQYLEAQRLLLKLGNAVVAAQTTTWQNMAGKQLKQDLQVCSWP